MRIWVWFSTAALCISLLFCSCKKDNNPISDSIVAEPVFKVVFVANNDLCIIDSDGSNYQAFASGRVTVRDADLSPDCSKIVYAGVDTTYQQIFLIDLNTRKTTNLTNDNVFHEMPKFSPDGKSIIYLTAQGWLSNIVRRNLETGEFIKLTEGLNCYSPSFSPSGSQIIFWLNNGGDSVGIVTMNSDGKNKKLIAGSGYSPMFFPDGGKILYQYPTSAHDEGLFSINIDGTRKKFLTNIPWQTKPNISPDGSKIVLSNFMNNFDIFMMDSDGNNVIHLTKDTAAEYQPSFSPNGNSICFISFDTSSTFSLEFMKKDGSDRRCIFRSHGSIYDPIH